MKKVIAVYGNPGCGKSGVSLALAASLAAKKKDVILISGDRVTPMLKVYAPKEEVTQSLSIGSLLMESDITERLVSNHVVFHPKSNNLAFMGMASMDNIATYPPRFIEDRVTALFGFLYRLCDYLIVDCSCNFLSDDIALKGLEVANIMVELITPNIAGLEFWNSMNVILRDERFSHSVKVPVISNAKPISPVRELQEVGRAVLGDIRYVLPYSYEVEDRMMCGKLIKWLGRKEGIAFENIIEQIVKNAILAKPSTQGEDNGRTESN